MFKKKGLSYSLILVIAVGSLMFSCQDAYGIVIGQPTFSLSADYCLTPSVISSTCDTTNNCPDPGDVITISANITNDTSSFYFPLNVIFRVEGTNPSNQLVDLLYGGNTYINNVLRMGGLWDDSFDEVVNTPEIAAGGSYTVKANYSVLRQQLQNIFALGNGDSVMLTVRVEVFENGFNSYLGTNTTQLKVTNRSIKGCGGRRVTQDAAPVMMVINAAEYTTSDTVYVEWSVLAAADETGGPNITYRVPTWGDTNNGIIDIIRLDNIPSGDPETDCANACGGAANCGTDSCTNLEKSITTWTKYYIPTCARPCSATDENLSNTYYFSYYDTSLGANTFTNYASFLASDLTVDKYYLVRLRVICDPTDPNFPNCGTPSHTIRGPQWTYFKIWSPTLAIISSFNAYQDNGRAVVEWETTAEANTVGFYLLRFNETEGTYEIVNKKLIPAFIGFHRGGIYRVVDYGAIPGETYTYKLLEIEGKGAKIEHGPFKVKVAGTGSFSIPVFSSFNRQAHEMSNKEKARINAGKEFRKAARLLKKMKKGNQIKISVTENGLYYLDASEISTLLGMNLQKTINMIKNNLLSLSNMGKKVAYLPDKDYKGIFFYGEGIESNYTKENIYWLYQGKGLRMGYISGNGPSFLGAGTFTDTLHLEEDLWDAPALFHHPEADYWFWDFIFSGYPDMDRKTYTFKVNGVANISSTATLTAHLQGVTDTHHVVISLNGTIIGEERWDGVGPHKLVITFSQDLLKEGDNTVEVQGVLDNGVDYSLFLIDSFDLSYNRLYRAVNNSLHCRGDGNPVVTIEGFTNPSISVFDVTDPGRPIINRAITIDGINGNYRVSFVPASPQARYLALSSDAISSKLDKRTNAPSNLSSKSNRADYLIITVSELKDSAQSLASYRNGTGFQSMVVDLEDIMDEFNYGIFNPEAVKSFLSYAYNNWAKSPRYVVFVGEGSDDYKNNLGFGDSMVPTMRVDTPYGLSPSDNYFVDIDNDYVPEMAIGRLPVLTAEELQSYISKLIAYEGASSGTWRKNIIMSADASTDAGDFPADSDGIASLVPAGYTVNKIYLSEHSLNEARQILLDQISNGSLLLNYIGHSSIDRLSNAGLLTSDDVPILTNGERMPVVTAMTCFMNNFSYPGYDTLGEVLVTKAGGGAIAVFGPTGLSINSNAVGLDKKLFTSIFRNGKKIIGDAVLQAMEEYRKNDSTTFILDIYNLLGDPALKMK